MKLIIGLGNPGDTYRGTRHNIGRRLIEFMAARHHLNFKKKKSLGASVAEFQWEGGPVMLAFPEVFMNQSGIAASRLVRHCDINCHRSLLIVVDDAALPFGQLRLRARGSDGGHNGLKSVHAALGSMDYPRLRLGIGGLEAAPEPAEALERYVLSPFSPTEKKQLQNFLEKAHEACRLWTAQSMEQAMNIVNTKNRIS